ncbi:MAG: N-6 DNA methylase [Myxococcales bacterium]|nr:N-6 DNA methylase [Myxococcales bacterium]
MGTLKTSSGLGALAARSLAELAADVSPEVRRRTVVCLAARALAEQRGLEPTLLRRLRIFEAEVVPATGPGLDALRLHFATAEVDELGQLYELTLEVHGRKRSGSYYTPQTLTRAVTTAAFAAAGGPRVGLRICDPALGGGAFLLEAARQLAAPAPADRALRRSVLERSLYGADISPLAVAVAEAVLWLWCNDGTLDPRVLRRRLVVQDALERGWEHELDGDTAAGFDVVLGNPPWVAFAGRAAQPLERQERRRLSEAFSAFRGYPTLHGLFVERATELAKTGIIALVVPSPLADLEGYRPVRRALGVSHAPVEPLLEFGQDAFEGVTQPCFALIAAPGSGAEDGRPFRLVERQRAGALAAEIAVPEVLSRMSSLPSLPRELFGELGFQSAGEVASSLFLWADAPDERHTVPLLEGKRVSEFHVGAPRLFLWPEPSVLARSRCRLRPPEHFARARFVVRQTAKFPIAALHTGLPFRNTLLAGFQHEDISPAFAVALLNSSLYRALHLAARRDARQAVFPQVKVAHLRALPAPPHHPEKRHEISQLTHQATNSGTSQELRSRLDELIFDLFSLRTEERAAVLSFLADRAPRS